MIISLKEIEYILHSTRRSLGVSASSLIFLEKTPAGWVEIETLTKNFYLAQDNNEMTYYLHLANTDANLTLLGRATNFTVRNYNKSLNDFVFNLSKKSYIPGSLVYLKRYTEMTKEKYLV